MYAYVICIYIHTYICSYFYIFMYVIPHPHQPWSRQQNDGPVDACMWHLPQSSSGSQSIFPHPYLGL